MKQVLLSTFLLFAGWQLSFAQGTETFTNMPANDGSYTVRNWAGDNGINWVATEARTDQTINGRAITIRVGSLTAAAIPNGIATLSFSHQQKFTGSGGLLEVYINNVLVGTANPTATVATASLTGLNVSGSFSIEIRQVTPNLRIAIDDVTWTSNLVLPACLEPTAQPTGLNLLSTAASVSGNFTAASPAADGYLVVRSTSNNLTVLPADGTSYTAGQVLGNGTVVTTTSAANFIDNGLSPSTLYYYFVFAENDQDCSGSPNYLLLAALAGSVSTQPIPACASPGAVTGLTLSAGNHFIGGSFSASAGANRYLAIISTSSSLGASPVNGITYSAGQAFGSGTVLSYSGATTLSATALNVNTVYYIFVFAAAAECIGEPFYSSVTSATVTTTNTSTGIPVGFYDGATGLACQPLKTALKNISATGYTQLSYTPGVWNAYQYTDIKPSTSNIIWDVYTDDNDEAVPETYSFLYSADQCGNYNSEGDCYNREHTTPQSWFNSASPMVSDVHHLFPTDGWVNGKRNNFPYGEVTNAAFTSIDNQSKLGTGNNFGYTGTVFEPNDAFKGDLARVSLYMATRYEDNIITNNWAGNAEANVAMLTAAEQTDAAMRRLQVYETWYLQTLFKWMAEDPVSQKEIDRNNAIYFQTGQHNRNPFVDHPEYAALIWQCTGVVPVTITSFMAVNNSRSVQLRWFATQETNFVSYEIERSTDGIHFNVIGTVAGRNLANYDFADENLPRASVLYYRLRMVDADGSARYSSIVSAKRSQFFSSAQVYPNPVYGRLKVKLESVLITNAQIRITDITGRVVKQFNLGRGTQFIDVDVAALSTGKYFFSINDGKQIINDSFVVMH